MRAEPTPARHAVLFELLRQQCLSERTSDRLRQSRKPAIGHGEAMMLQSLAMRSWSEPRSATKTAH